MCSYNNPTWLMPHIVCVWPSCRSLTLNSDQSYYYLLTLLRTERFTCLFSLLLVIKCELSANPTGSNENEYLEEFSIRTRACPLRFCGLTEADKGSGSFFSEEKYRSSNFDSIVMFAVRRSATAGFDSLLHNRNAIGAVSDSKVLRRTRVRIRTPGHSYGN